MNDIAIQFKNDFKSPTSYFRTAYNLERLLIVAQSKVKEAKEFGEAVLQNKLTYLAENLDLQIEQENSQNQIDRAAMELLLFSCLLLTEFKGIDEKTLCNATIECIYSKDANGVMLNLASTQNPFHQNRMCSSIHIDAFSDEYNSIIEATNKSMGLHSTLIDQLVMNYDKLIDKMSKIQDLDPLLSSFILNIKQDIAPAIFLTMGGRSDTGYSLARRTLEIVGFAQVIANDKTASELWISSQGKPELQKQFRKRFKSELLFPKIDPVWDGAFKRYDVFSKLHHPTPMSFNRMDWDFTDENKLKVTVRPTSFDKSQSDKIAVEAWTVLEAYAYSLMCFEYLLRTKVDASEMRQEIADLVIQIGELAEIITPAKADNKQSL